METLELPNYAARGFIPTLNKMGFMTDYLDDFSRSFAEYSGDIALPLLEIGSAYGIATIEALKNGRRVVSNDIEPQHLDILKSLTPNPLRSNLKTVSGDFLAVGTLELEPYAAILACRVFHFFNEDQFPRALSKCFDLLAPNGKLFIVLESPFLRSWIKHYPVYLENKRAGKKFPGLIKNASQYTDYLSDNLPGMINLFDTETLERELLSAGFTIEKCEYIDRKFFPPEARLDGRESIGAIAMKSSQLTEV